MPGARLVCSQAGDPVGDFGVALARLLADALALDAKDLAGARPVAITGHQGTRHQAAALKAPVSAVHRLGGPPGRSAGVSRQGIAGVARTPAMPWHKCSWFSLATIT